MREFTGLQNLFLVDEYIIYIGMDNARIRKLCVCIISLQSCYPQFTRAYKPHLPFGDLRSPESARMLL